MKKTKKIIITAASVLFWLIAWQIAAACVDMEILLVSPVDVIKRLGELVFEGDFWQSVLFSMGRIMLGFAIGLASGTALAALMGNIAPINALFSPLISVMKSIPVASFTILALFWVGAENLSTLVAVLICVPIVCTNMLEGIKNLDPKLGQMARVFRIPFMKRFTGIYLSQLMPYFRSAATLAIGLSWKSGVAAEVIGIPNGSIGERLYSAKVYLETGDLFAWTAAVILLSRACELVFGLILKVLKKKIESR